MKNLNILILTTTLLLLNCSNTVSWDGYVEPSNYTYFSPPIWIQGVWSNNENQYYTYKFTNNDFIINYDPSAGYGVSYNERINILGTNNLNATEQITSTSYSITILHLKTNTTIYTFNLISENEISCHFEKDEWGEITIEDYSMFKI